MVSLMCSEPEAEKNKEKETENKKEHQSLKKPIHFSAKLL